MVSIKLEGDCRFNRFLKDPLDFDKKCDQSLPLEDLLSENPQTRKLLQDINRSKTRVWALTNAYITVRSFIQEVKNDIS